VDVEPVLRQHLAKLEGAFSDNRFPLVKEQLSVISRRDEVIRRQWERESNRRLYD
jgi:hypothetical protein